MRQFQAFLTTLCVLSMVTGLSVIAVCSWALYIRTHTLDQLYPEAADFVRHDVNACQASRRMWHLLQVNWESAPLKDVAVIGLSLATAIIQFIFSTIILYAKSNEKTLGKRFIFCNIALFMVFLGCAIATTSYSNLTRITKIPTELRRAMDLDPHNLVFAFLKCGLNSFTVWLGMDLLFLLLSVLIMSAILGKASYVF